MKPEFWPESNPHWREKNQRSWKWRKLIIQKINKCGYCESWKQSMKKSENKWKRRKCQNENITIICVMSISMKKWKMSAKRMAQRKGEEENQRKRNGWKLKAENRKCIWRKWRRNSWRNGENDNGEKSYRNGGMAARNVKYRIRLMKPRNESLWKPAIMKSQRKSRMK